MFICVDLKVIEGLADATARSAGVEPDRILAGLVRLWHRCWADEADHLSKGELAGIFGGRKIGDVLEALVEFGFLEPAEGTWRVRGAERYLRLKESRRRGAEKTNAARARSKSDALKRSGATLNDALSPSHRVTESPRTEKAASPPDDSAAFQGWVNDARAEIGVAPEKPIADLNRRLAPVLLELNGDMDRLKAGYLEYLHHESKHWAKQKPRHPLRGFLSQALDFVPDKAIRSVAGPALSPGWAVAIAGMSNRYVADRLSAGHEGQLLEREGQLVISTTDQVAVAPLGELLAEHGLSVLVEVHS